MKNLFYKNQKGFTLIELLVATSLFTIIAVGGVSVLLSAQRTYKRISNNRIAIDNINLVLNNMSREIRFGTDYSCVNDLGDGSVAFNESNFYNRFPRNFSEDSTSNTCNAIAFSPQGSTSTKIVYYFNSDTYSINEADYLLDGSANNFDKKKDLSMTSQDFKIDNFNLDISGTSKTDNIQPKVKIFISGIIATVKDSQGVVTATSTFSVQEVVSQRTLDN